MPSTITAAPPPQRCAAGYHPDEGDSLEELDQRLMQHLAQLASPRGIAAASNRELGVALGVHATTARRALTRLIDAGDLELLTRGTGGRYRSRYRLLGTASPTTASQATA